MATVVAAHGRHFFLQATPSYVEPLILAHTRGKRNDFACGDQVRFHQTGPTTGVIETLLPRSTLLYRADAVRQKLIAANVDLVLLVTATTPPFSTELLSRSLVAAEAQGIAACLVLNKCDIAHGVAAALQLLASFKAAGYPVIQLAARQSAAPLAEWLAGRRAVLVGQSGMGKSTLINALIPEASARTGEISRALGSGRHTTTFTRLYPYQGGGWIIDSPGLQRFGLAHINPAALAGYFPEFRPFLGQCRFRDCRHDAKSHGCAIAAAVAQGAIASARWRHYLTIANELNEQPVTAARRSP